MLNESYKREDITPPLSREEGRSHNSETGTDTNRSSKPTHTRGRERTESKRPQDMDLVEAREGRGPTGTGVTGENMLISQRGNGTL